MNQLPELIQAAWNISNKHRLYWYWFSLFTLLDYGIICSGVTRILWCPSQRPIMQSIDCFFVFASLNKLFKLSHCQWYDTPWHSRDIIVVMLSSSLSCNLLSLWFVCNPSWQWRFRHIFTDCLVRTAKGKRGCICNVLSHYIDRDGLHMSWGTKQRMDRGQQL